MFRHRSILVAHILGWLLYGLLDHISHIVYQVNHWQGSIGGAVLGMLLTFSIACFHEKTAMSNKVLHYFVFGSLLFVVSVIWHNLTRIWHGTLVWQNVIENPGLEWLDGNSYTMLLMSSWCGLYFAALYYADHRQQQIALINAKAQAKEAQLRTLRYQLNPHFLFNVLNSIDVAVLDKQNEVAHKMLSRLSRFLRSTLEHGETDKISLAQELAAVEDFIDIEKERFGNVFNIEFTVAVNAEDVFVPPMILQPLVENAVKFTWLTKEEKFISINCQTSGKHLQIRIENSCLDPEEGATISIKPKGTRTGLQNTSQRLKEIYGDQAQLVTSYKNGKFNLLLELPLEETVQ